MECPLIQSGKRNTISPLGGFDRAAIQVARLWSWSIAANRRVEPHPAGVRLRRASAATPAAHQERLARPDRPIQFIGKAHFSAVVARIRGLRPKRGGAAIPPPQIRHCCWNLPPATCVSGPIYCLSGRLINGSGRRSSAAVSSSCLCPTNNVATQHHQRSQVIGWGVRVRQCFPSTSASPNCAVTILAKRCDSLFILQFYWMGRIYLGQQLS